MRHRLYFLEDGLLVGDNGPEVWLKLPTTVYETLSYDQRCQAVEDDAGLLTALRGYHGHLLVVPKAISLDRWERYQLEQNPRATPAWKPYVTTVKEYLSGGAIEQPEVFLDNLTTHLGAHMLSTREVYLLIRLRTEKPLDWLTRFWRKADAVIGLQDPRGPNKEELVELRRQASTLLRSVTGGRAGTRFATAAEMRWQLGRIHSRGINDPEDQPSRPAWGGELRMLTDGMIDNYGRFLHLNPPGGPVCAVLSFGHMPQKLEIPGGEWLYHFDAAGFPVEASVRFNVVAPAQAANDMEAALAAAKDMAENLPQGHELPLDLQETLEAGTLLQYDTRKRQKPQIYCWPRLLVSANEPHELEARVGELVRMYQDLGIDLTASADDQLRFFEETVPGGKLSYQDSKPAKVTFRSYEQRMPVETLAGGLATASSDLGQFDAPYIAVTSGSGHGIVGWDPFRAQTRHQSTVSSFTGPPGGGKSYALKVAGAQMRMRGAAVLHIDPPGSEAARLQQLPELGRVEVIEFNEEHAGWLDPFSIEEDKGDAALLAAGILRQFLPVQLGRDVDDALLTAAEDVRDDPSASLVAVVDRLGDYGDENIQRAHRALRSISRLPMASTCFTPHGAAVRQLKLEDAYTVLSLAKLRLPDAAKPIEDYDIDERLGVGLFQAVFQLADRLMDMDIGMPKGCILDEVWLATRASQGTRLTNKVGRMGRKKDSSLLVASQLAADVIPLAPFITSRFQFRCKEMQEIHDACAYLAIEPSPYHASLIKGMAPGECLYQDLVRDEPATGRIKWDAVLRSWDRVFDTSPKRMQVEEEAERELALANGARQG